VIIAKIFAFRNVKMRVLIMKLLLLNFAMDHATSVQADAKKYALNEKKTNNFKTIAANNQMLEC